MPTLDGYPYPNAGDPADGPGAFLALIQAIITKNGELESGITDVRQIKTYVWADAAERGGTFSDPGDMGIQLDTNALYGFDSGNIPRVIAILGRKRHYAIEFTGTAASGGSLGSIAIPLQEVAQRIIVTIAARLSTASNGTASVTTTATSGSWVVNGNGAVPSTTTTNTYSSMWVIEIPAGTGTSSLSFTRQSTGGNLTISGGATVEVVRAGEY